MVAHNGGHGNVISTLVYVRHAKCYSVTNYQDSRLMHVTQNVNLEISHFDWMIYLDKYNFKRNASCHDLILSNSL